MTITKHFLAILLIVAPPGVFAQKGLDPSLLLEPPIDAWPTYHGDYSGRHYSSLQQINSTNVKGLSLAWIYRANFGSAGAIVGGEGTDEFAGGSIKAIPLMVNGVLYFTTPDNAFAVDARTGRQLWHYFWKTKGGIHIGNRGMGMYGNWLFFETPDNYLVSLDAATGKERWHKVIADVKQEYFSTPAPLIIRNHVIVGLGGDSLDVPGWLESRVAVGMGSATFSGNGIRRRGQANRGPNRGRTHTRWSMAVECRGNLRPTTRISTFYMYRPETPTRSWPDKAETATISGRPRSWP